MLKIKLNESELQELQERLKQAKSQSTLVYLDLKIIEFSDQGKSVPQIDGCWDCIPRRSERLSKVPS
ncbi:MAG: hypothetical protein H6633_12910 [Anaerolineales bacterium]|nr:hypothetical protein [Anaerolineales bacterium]